MTPKNGTQKWHPKPGGFDWQGSDGQLSSLIVREAEAPSHHRDSIGDPTLAPRYTTHMRGGSGAGEGLSLKPLLFFRASIGPPMMPRCQPLGRVYSWKFQTVWRGCIGLEKQHRSDVQLSERLASLGGPFEALKPLCATLFNTLYRIEGLKRGGWGAEVPILPRETPANVNSLQLRLPWLPA